MARNSEKAMTTLARWRAANIENKKDKEIRPYLASECNDLKKAEMFRRQIMAEVVKMVAQVQNAGLGAYKLRELNDQINKRLRERRHWEDRIRELGGRHYRRNGPRVIENEGQELPTTRGYKYFGATRDLPGVKELFERDVQPVVHKTRAQLMKDISFEFYGYCMEDDDVLLPFERELEAEVRQKKIEERRALLEQESQKEMEDGKASTSSAPTEVEKELNLWSSEATGSAHVAVPTLKEIEQALVLRKKREILEKYVSVDLLNDEEETKRLLGLD